MDSKDLIFCCCQSMTLLDEKLTMFVSLRFLMNSLVVKSPLPPAPPPPKKICRRTASNFGLMSCKLAKKIVGLRGIFTQPAVSNLHHKIICFLQMTKSFHAGCGVQSLQSTTFSLKLFAVEHCTWCSSPAPNAPSAECIRGEREPRAAVVIACSAVPCRAALIFFSVAPSLAPG